MKTGFMRKLANVVSGRLMVLRKNVKHALFGKNTMRIRGRIMEMKSTLRGWVSGFSSYLLAAMAMLRLLLSKDAFQTYSAWCRKNLNRDALRGYVAAAADWTKVHLGPEALKGYARAAVKFLRELPEKLTWENVKKLAARAWQWILTLPVNLKKIRKNALVASVALFALWLIMGATTSMAWLTHQTPVERNSFTVGKMNLVVEYQNQKMEQYEPMDEKTAVFDDKALYEPGYTQVVYFKITNEGNVEFDYKILVTAAGYEDSTNVYGQPLHLPKYLRYGLITAGSPLELDRKVAQALADMDVLDLYTLGSDPEIRYGIAGGEYEYAALIVYMPEEVGNEANYRGEHPPKVYLGVQVYAQQAGTME
ncbi:MAG: hypothetical protein J6V25_08360 [Oscillospiraceae bacterium]|nr:hypothetical protein [Oscillospiraceae bacterium]